MQLVKLLKLTLSGAIIISVAGCENNIGGVTDSNKQKLSQGTKQSANIKDDVYMLRMGGGYDSSSNTGTSGQSCLKASYDNNNMIIANPEAIITFDQQQDFSALQNNLGVNVNGSYGGDRFNMSGSAMFAKSSEDNSYTTNIVYLYKYSGKAIFKNGSLHHGDDALTDVAKSYVHTEKVFFRDMCGDSFVEQMDAGALLGVRLTLSFNSHMDKQKFGASLAAKIGLADVAAAIEQASTNSNVHVNFSLSAIQKGGQPQNLNDLFGKVDESGNYAFTNCGSVGGSDSRECKRIINGIIAYGQTMKDQLANPDGSLKFDNFYYSNPTITKYTRLGIEEGAPNPSAEILAAMQSLTKAYDKTLYDRIFVSHYKEILFDKMDSATKEAMQDAEVRLNNQLSNVYLSPAYKLFNCYKGYVSENCLKIKKNVEDALKDFALVDNEQQLIDYFEANSYSAKLYNYYRDVGMSSDSYQISPNECILVPISAPNDASYVLNCNGKWLDFVNEPIHISEVYYANGSSALGIDNFKYYSKNASNNPIVENNPTRVITYPNSILVKDSFFPNNYKIDGLTITSAENSTAKESEITRTGKLQITKLHQNQG